MLKQLFDSTGYSILLLLRSIVLSRLAFRRAGEVINQMFIVLCFSMPLIFVTGFFSGLIMSYQIGGELDRFGEERIIGFAVPAALLREIGPVFCAMGVAGLVGSKYSAEIATMKISEEIDALKVMSIDPVYFVVMPRFVALVLCMPVLALFTSFVGIVGGGLISNLTFGVSIGEYLYNAQSMMRLGDIYIGLLKAFVFGIIVSAVSCSQGLRASHGPEGVGRSVLGAVVGSFIFIIFFDYVITWIFY